MIVTKRFTGNCYYSIPREGHYSITLSIPGLTEYAADDLSKKVEEINCNYINGAIELRNYNLVSINYKTTEVKIEFDCVAFHGGSPAVTEVSILLSIDILRYQINGQDPFKNFEQWHAGPQAMPEAYFKGCEDHGQGYDEKIVPGAVKEIADYHYQMPDNNGDWQPIIGCHKNSVVKAGSTHRLYSTNKEITTPYTIWYSYEDGCIMVQEGDAPATKLPYTKDLLRAGIVMVGRGNTGNSCVLEEDRREIDDDIVWPSTGGGGGETVWAVLHLAFTTKMPATGESAGSQVAWCYPIFRVERCWIVDNIHGEAWGLCLKLAGKYTRKLNTEQCDRHMFLMPIDILFVAGGYIGAKFKTIETTINNKGIKYNHEGTGHCKNGGQRIFDDTDLLNKYKEYITVVERYNGKDGGWYNWSKKIKSGHVDWDNTGSSNTNLDIQFLKSDDYVLSMHQSVNSNLGSMKNTIEKHGKTWYVVAGGNSYGRGARAYLDSSDTIHFERAGIGGGGCSFSNRLYDRNGDYNADDPADGNLKDWPANALESLSPGRAYFALYF